MYTEIFQDASGLGNQVSVSIPIFDESVYPKFLVGVYGLNLVIDKLSIFNDYENQLVEIIKNADRPPTHKKENKVNLE